MGWLVVVGICAGAILIYRAITGTGGGTGRPLPERIGCLACREQIMVGAAVCPYCKMQYAEGDPLGYMRAALQVLEDEQDRRADRAHLRRLVDWIVFATCAVVLAAAVLRILAVR